jgi:hypothetical protein
MRYALPSLIVAATLLQGGCTPDQPLAPDVEPAAPARTLVPATGYVQALQPYFNGCALRTDGIVVCWDDDSAGLMNVPLITDAVQIAAGFGHACALRAGGTVVCWGASPGDDAPPGLTGVSQLTANSAQSCALVESDGSVVCWGNDIQGSTDPPDGLVGVTQVSAGWGHACAVKSDATVVCWGFGSNGETTPPPGLNDVVDLDAGDQHTCALRSTGTVACWGLSASGQTNVPADLDGVVQVSAGYDFSCALGDAGEVVCWGGSGGAYPSDDVQGDVAWIDANYPGTCVVLLDATARCFGGASDPPQRILPEATFKADPTAVVAGESFGLALEGARVPGYSGPVTFTYAFDCGSGYGSFTSTGTATCEIVTGGEHQVRGQVRDQDGDVSEYTALVEVTPDETPPTIVLTAPADGAVYLVGESLMADYACADPESGIASCEGTVANGEPIPTSAAGPYAFIVDAENVAGGTASTTHDYTVVYDFSGFADPISNDQVNVVRAGATVPLAWRLLDAAGTPIVGLTDVSVTVSPLQCDAAVTVTQLPDEDAAGRSGLQDLGDGEYQFNWKTPKTYAGSCMTLHLDLGEGSTRTALFSFTK